MKISTFLRSSFSLRLKAILAQGIAPGELAWALSVGVVIGLSPLLWGTTLLCAALAALLRLNPVAVHLANVAVWPLQVALFLPWVRLGGEIFGASPECSSSAAASGFSPVELLSRYGEANLKALLVWALASPLAAAILFTGFRFICERWSRRPPARTTKITSC